MYILTFFSHYDAMVFEKKANSLGVQVELIPVPRGLSSSCGTAVRISGDFPEDVLGVLEHNRGDCKVLDIDVDLIVKQ